MRRSLTLALFTGLLVTHLAQAADLPQRWVSAGGAMTEWVAAAGMIGFIGLIVPHLVRLLAGPDHRVLLPASELAGASLLLFADLFARLVLAPAELPIGIVTAFLGAPFFLYLLIHGRT
jgi:ABC-type Fe3+-siderophore transport system permease subunit